MAGQARKVCQRVRPVITADDFGLCEAVNEGVERAHREGVLTSASLMVAGDAAADAVRRAKQMPALNVGLHLVVIEGASVLRDPVLTDARGWFGSNQLRLGINYFFRPRTRRALAAEIRAQFVAFAKTGLTLHHADAHKHMHLHPTVGRMIVDIGREFGLPALRVPAEPPVVTRQCGVTPSLGSRAMYAWSHMLRRQGRRAGLALNDAAFGIAWSGHMTETRVLKLIGHLPDGANEIYFHPAAYRDATLDRLMPDYEHEAELAALLSARVRAALEATK